ncbi:hypothetical protein EB093_04920 [bacterium]|nr:hypothetical protein [bacterium]
MDISGITGHIAPLAPRPVRSVPGDINLAAIRTGNLDADYVHPSEFGGRDSDTNLLKQLSVIRQDTDTTSSRLLQKLESLQTLKRSENPSDRIDAIKEFGRLATYSNEDARSIGAAGLLSVMYTTTNADELLLTASLLIFMLDPKSAGSIPEFERMAQSILLSFVANKENMNFQAIQEILQSIERLQLSKFAVLTPHIEEFIQKPVAALDQVAQQIQSGRVQEPMTISELVAAENIKNIPQAVQPSPASQTHSPVHALDAVLASLQQVRLMMIYSLWPSLLKSTELVMLVMLLDRIGQNIARQRRKMKRLIAALVSHPSATVPDDILAKSPIYIVEYDPENYIRIFHDKFLELQDSGFNSVFALLPHSDFWHSYHHARHALTRPTANIIVIDTKLYGAALGLLVREVSARMVKLQRRDDIHQLIQKMLPKIHYWIAPAQTKAINSHFWYQKMRRQSLVKEQLPTNPLPIIGFGETAGVVGCASTITQSLVKLEAMVVEQFQRTGVIPSRMIIEHHGMLPAAVSLETYFKKIFPKITTAIQPTTPFLSHEIGEFVGVLAV